MSAAHFDRNSEAFGDVQPAAAWHGNRDRRARMVPLFDLDPELAADLGGERLSAARTELQVRVVPIGRGQWTQAQERPIGRENFGLLMVDGVVAREVVLEDTVSTELIGPGDVIRPWSGREQPHLLDQQVRWQVLADAHVALLGRAFAGAVTRYPEINTALTDRLCQRAQRLATLRAISSVNLVDRRLLALFWHLAERWGRVTSDGVVVPLALSHRLLGELVGARRPTVTVAIGALEREGRLLRRSDATWLLTGEPAGTPAETVRRVIAHRRRLIPKVPDADVPA
jgi:CRP/FNR family cyclic AMP-dependent transcriptional regulator